MIPLADGLVLSLRPLDSFVSRVRNRPEGGWSRLRAMLFLSTDWITWTRQRSTDGIIRSIGVKNWDCLEASTSPSAKKPLGRPKFVATKSVSASIVFTATALQWVLISVLTLGVPSQ